MKKVFAILTIAILLTSAAGMAIAQDYGHNGPAPNSGDGVPDGSGFDSPNGPNDSDAAAGSGPAGPAPNSGDGIPDGSGFDCPNGPNKPTS